MDNSQNFNFTFEIIHADAIKVYGEFGMIISAGRSFKRTWKKNWRVFEREACQKYFGEIIDVNCEDGYSVVSSYNKFHPQYIRWYPDPELTTLKEWDSMAVQANECDVKHINHPKGFDQVQCKEKAFEVWQKNGIKVPYWGYNQCDIVDYPILVRLNDDVAGGSTILVTTPEELIWVEDPDTGRIGTRMIWVEFVNTEWRGHKRSFRIHVAGDKIISGYARIGQDWCVVTKGFKPSMERDWVDAQKDCERLIQLHGEEIIRSVKVLGLNMEGVDIIIAKDDDTLTPIFLEVQPTYASGYSHIGYANYYPPYWNPSPILHPELVQFITNNITMLKREIPRYCDYWLDKRNHFDAVYKALREAKCLVQTE